MKNEAASRSFDQLLDALADVQRRTLLVALLEHTPQDDAPVVLADSEDEAGDSIERLVRMDHVHLPTLEAYGFIEWNEQSHGVARGPNFEEIRPLLADHDEELPAGWL